MESYYTAVMRPSVYIVLRQYVYKVVTSAISFAGND